MINKRHMCGAWAKKFIFLFENMILFYSENDKNIVRDSSWLTLLKFLYGILIHM